MIPDINIISIHQIEAWNHRLLSRQEEHALARRYQHSRRLGAHYLRHNSAFAPYIEVQIAAGITARNTLVRHNIRLCVSIAKKYRRGPLDFEDLLQYAYLGLLRAIDRFEPARGYKLITYAKWWIQQQVDCGVANDGRTMRVPVHRNSQIVRVYQARERLAGDFGRDPTLDELAAETGFDVDHVTALLVWGRPTISLDVPVGEDGDTSFGELQASDGPVPADEAALADMRDRIGDVLDTLKPREARIIRLRYGLDGRHPHTLEEIGQRFGLTRERIRQIEATALERMRHPSRARSLREYV